MRSAILVPLALGLAMTALSVPVDADAPVTVCPLAGWCLTVAAGPCDDGVGASVTWTTPPSSGHTAACAG